MSLEPLGTTLQEQIKYSTTREEGLLETLFNTLDIGRTIFQGYTFDT
jgi:hypothetical protein